MYLRGFRVHTGLGRRGARVSCIRTCLPNCTLVLALGTLPVRPSRTAAFDVLEDRVLTMDELMACGRKLGHSPEKARAMARELYTEAKLTEDTNGRVKATQMMTE